MIDESMGLLTLNRLINTLGLMRSNRQFFLTELAPCNGREAVTNSNPMVNFQMALFLVSCS